MSIPLPNGSQPRQCYIYATKASCAAPPQLIPLGSLLPAHALTVHLPSRHRLSCRAIHLLPTPSMAFQTLPLELHSSVLRCLASPQDLLSVMIASPGCLAAFENAPRFCLASVLRNAIEPEVMPHALAALATLRFKATNYPRPDMNSFIDEYFGARSFEFPTDVRGLTSFCRLYSVISYFMDDYIARAVKSLYDDESPAETPAILPPSPTERARLQRAFFRYEIYCALFPPPDSLENPPAPVSTPREQFRRFLRRLSALHVEEMCCIHFYFASVVRKVIDGLEDQLVAEVLDAVRGAADAPGDKTTLTSYPPYASREANRVLHYFASFGSLSMRRLVRADQDGRRNMLRRFREPIREFLPEVLSLAGTGVSPTRESHSSSCVYSDLDIFALLKQGYYIPINSGYIYCALRERAYVFWDRDRIMLGHVKRNLEDAASMEYVVVAETYNRRHRRTVRQRIGNAQMLESDSDRIEARYGLHEDYDHLQDRVTLWTDLID